MNKFKFIFSCVSLILAALTIHSCAKESNVANDDTTENVSKEDQALAQNIMNFHKAMMAGELQLRSGGDGPSEYTPEVFLKNTEEAINYTYAIPFDKYWDVETRKDTIPITIADCKILSIDGPAKYQQVLNKIICKYTCSDLTNKKLKCVKVSLVSKTCTQLIVEVVSSVGSTDVTASLGEPNPPAPSALANYKRKFTNSLWATFGTCSTPNLGKISAPEEMGEKATWNIIGGYDLNHTLINIETRYLSSNDPTPDWWKASCHEPWIDPNESNTPCSYINCDDWFSINDWGVYTYTTAGIEKYCLQPADLNARLSSTETACTSIAAAANKHFVNLDQYVTWGLCLGYNIELWWGELTIGRKLYRYQVDNLPTSACNCTE